MSMSSPKRRAGSALVIAAAASPSAVYAQLQSHAEAAFFEDLPVVLSVSRLPQSLADAPGAVTVVDRETIRATGYRNLPDLLRLVPGFNVAWLRGWWGVVNYHGLSGDYSNRVLVLVDGRPLNSEYFNGGIDWLGQPLALDDIERIEVLRGSNSAAYGTNAFLGVVNVITRHATQGQGIYVAATRGQGGINDQTLRAGASLSNLDLRLTLNQTKDRGLDNLSDSNRLNFANLRADWRLTSSDELTLSAGMQRGVGVEGFAEDPFNPLRDRVAKNDFVQLKWRHVFSPEQELSLQFYRNHDRWREETQIDLPPPFGSVDFDQNRKARRSSAELQYFGRLTPDLRAVAGVEWRSDRVDSEFFFGSGNPAGSHTLRLFGNLEWRVVEPLRLNLGVMSERHSITGTRSAPRLFANYEVQPGHVLRAGVSSANRIPTLFELLGDSRFVAPGVPSDNVILGNRHLARERILAREIGYFGQFRTLGLQIDARLYQELLRDLIDVVPLADRRDLLDFQRARSYSNIDQARIRGLSYQVKLKPFDGAQVALGQSFQRVSHPTEQVRDGAPSHSTSLMWVQRLPWDLSLTLIHYAVGAIYWDGFGDRIDGFRRTDARLGYRFRLGSTRGEASLVGLNLFGKYNEFKNGRDEPSSEYEFSRRVYATLRLEL